MRICTSADLNALRPALTSWKRNGSDQQSLVEHALEDAVEAAICWTQRGLNETMNRFNRRTNAEKVETER
jgi:hypothetical protein